MVFLRDASGLRNENKNTNKRNAPADHITVTQTKKKKQKNNIKRFVKRNEYETYVINIRKRSYLNCSSCTTTFKTPTLHTNSPLHTHNQHLLFVLQFAVSNMIAICFITLFLLSVALTLSIGLYFFCIIFPDTHFAYHFVSTVHTATRTTCARTQASHSHLAIVGHGCCAFSRTRCLRLPHA